MAAETPRLSFEVVTPAGRVLEAKASDVYLDTLDGEIGILPGHADLVTVLNIGVLSYTTDGGRRAAAVQGGSATVTGGSLVSIATPRFTPAEEIDGDAIKARLETLEAGSCTGIQADEAEYCRACLQALIKAKK